MFFVSGRLLIAQIAAPFFTVYMLRTLEISYAQIAVFSAIQTITTIIMNPFWGYLADKYGYKPVMSLTAIGLAVFPLGWSLVNLDNYWLMVPLVQIWAGCMSAGWGTAQFNLMVSTAPEANRSAFLGCFAAVSRAGAALGAGLGGLSADLCMAIPTISILGHTVAGLQYLFLFNGVLRISYLGVLARTVTDSQLSPRDVINRVRKGNPITALWHLVRMVKSNNPTVRARAAHELGQTGSHLAVDELISLLNDSDRNVRREAVQSLSRIGAEDAINPLIECIGNPSSDIAEEAVEALGAVPSALSLNILVTLLNDTRVGIRKNAIVALDRIGDRRSERSLEVLLVNEQEPSIVRLVIETLAKMGNPNVLERLQELIRHSENNLERRVLVMSVGHLLGNSEILYRLLQADEMEQDRSTVRIFNNVRRQLNGWLLVSKEKRAEITAVVDGALRYFERQGNNEMLQHLLEVSGEIISIVSMDSNKTIKGDLLPVHRPTGLAGIHLAYRILSDIEREGRTRILYAEEILLAVVAFQHIADLGIE